MLSLITGNNEQGYLNQVADLALWGHTNNLALNINKTKEMVLDFRRKQGSGLTPLIISGEPVEGPQFQVPGETPHSGSLMVSPHTTPGIQVKAAAVLPPAAEEVQGLPLHPEDLLLCSYGECPYRLHISLVWKLHRTKPGCPAEGAALSRAKH